MRPPGGDPLLGLLADGTGAVDVAGNEERAPRPGPALAVVAERHGGAGSRRPAVEVPASAAAFPGFEDDALPLCR
ncbi:hypothetical protein [Streptomyces sp. NPDC058084]|uniref:hypothetical protein n=1 Tax=Streptomyces sp. NPDC058084 TaxID=3346333 RepID=UPI0036EAB022